MQLRLLALFLSVTARMRPEKSPVSTAAVFGCVQRTNVVVAVILNAKVVDGVGGGTHGGGDSTVVAVFFLEV